MTLRNNKTKRWVWVLVMLVLIPTLVQAQNITTLIEMPTGEGDFNSYINAVYILSISVAALLAVVKIIIAGFKYMFSDIITQKSEAKKDIRNALIGLLIVLGAVLILEIINPELTQFNLDDVTAIDTYVPPSSSGGGDPDSIGSADDLQIIEEFCDANDGNCEATSCEYLRTDYFVSWLINEPLNRIACSLLCRGQVVGRDFLDEGVCLHPADEPPVTPIEEELVMACIQPSGVIAIDCSFAINQCINSFDGVPTSEENSSGVLQIRCTPSSQVDQEDSDNLSQAYVEPYEITSDLELSDLAQDLGVSQEDIIFAVEIPVDLSEVPGFEGVIEQICQTEANSLSNPNIELAYNTPVGRAVCVDSSSLQ